MTSSRQQGFTLLELMITVCVLSIVAALTVSFYRQGLLKDSSQSKLTRTLVSALHLARIRSTENLTVIPVTDGTYDSVNSVVIFTAANHGFSTGDYVALSRLDHHSNMNGAYYYVTTLDDNRFQCLHHTTIAVSDTTGRARSLNKAGKLVIWKRSAFKAKYPTLDEQLKQMANDENFVYDDTQFLLWNEKDATATKAAGSFPVSFTSRGFASVTTGYELRIGAMPLKPGADKIVTIRPSGAIKPGT